MIYRVVRPRATVEECGSVAFGFGSPGEQRGVVNCGEEFNEKTAVRRRLAVSFASVDELSQKLLFMKISLPEAGIEIAKVKRLASGSDFGSAGKENVEEFLPFM